MCFLCLPVYFVLLCGLVLCRVVPVPVRLLVLCITVTFRLSVRVSFLVCCGLYVCFSKLLTFHDSFIFFASRSCFKHYSKLQASGTWKESVPDCVFSEKMSKQ